MAHPLIIKGMVNGLSYEEAPQLPSLGKDIVAQVTLKFMMIAPPETLGRLAEHHSTDVPVPTHIVLAPATQTEPSSDEYRSIFDGYESYTDEGKEISKEVVAPFVKLMIEEADRRGVCLRDVLHAINLQATLNITGTAVRRRLRNAQEKEQNEECTATDSSATPTKAPAPTTCTTKRSSPKKS